MLYGKNDSEVVEILGLGKLYENKVGALFVQCSFFLSVFIFDGIFLASNFLVCLYFPADGCENRASLERNKQISRTNEFT